jgi:6-phosphogluconolactonase
MAQSNSVQVLVFPTQAEVSTAAVLFVAEASAASIAARGKFVIALSGGSMPAILAPLVESIPDDDWSKWHVFFVDERCVPLDDPESNFKACEAFLAKVPCLQVHPLPLSASVTLNDAASLAATYEVELRTVCDDDFGTPIIDLTLLGMGPGHAT